MQFINGTMITSNIDTLEYIGIEFHQNVSDKENVAETSPKTEKNVILLCRQCIYEHWLTSIIGSTDAKK